MSSDSVIVDTTAIYPEAAALDAALTARDWPACAAVLDAATPAARTELILRNGEDPRIEGLLGRTVLDEPDDMNATGLLASHYIRTGWNVRGAARARWVSAGDFDVFHRWLRKAERLLIEAAAARPEDPAIWSLRLVTARGLGMGVPETRRRYAHLAAADPHHLPGQWNLLQSLCPKWGGTWEEAHGFAREAAFAAPPGSPHGSLVAAAHLEHWLELSSDDEHLRRADVLAALHEAADHSIRHPGFTRDHGWVEALSTFAMAFSLAGDRRAAAPIFTELGPYASRYPWEYLRLPVDVSVRRHRARALKAGADA